MQGSLYHNKLKNTSNTTIYLILKPKPLYPYTNVEANKQLDPSYPTTFIPKYFRTVLDCGRVCTAVYSSPENPDEGSASGIMCSNSSPFLPLLSMV